MASQVHTRFGAGWRRFRAGLCGFGCAVFLSGCLRVEQTVNLRADGSGTVDVQYSLAEQTIAQIRGMMKLEAEMAAAAGKTNAVPDHKYVRLLMDPTEADLRSWLAGYSSNGVSVAELRVVSQETRRRVLLTLTFRSLAELARTDVFRDAGLYFEKTPEGLFLLGRKAMNPAAAEVLKKSDESVSKTLTPILSGFKIAVTVNVPGRIVKSTAHEASQFQAEWDYDYDRNPNAFLAFQSQEMRMLFDLGPADGMKDIDADASKDPKRILRR